MKYKYRTIPVEEVIAEFSPERQQRIKESQERFLKDYDRLQKIFKTLGVIQDDIIEKGDISYLHVSKPENLTESMIAFMKERFVDCGFELKIKTKAITAEGTKIESLAD